MSKNKKGLSRRDFVKNNSLAGLSIMATGPAIWNPGIEKNSHMVVDKTLHLRPRYHRWHVDPGVEWLESNTDYAYLDWTIPVSQVGLVLVDVWQRHYLQDTEDRAEKIIVENIVPLLKQCRQNGVEVIHAPSPPVAKKLPNWDSKWKEAGNNVPSNMEKWPPDDFRAKSGQFQEFHRPFEPREEERLNLPALKIHPKVEPLANEAVVGYGDQLHELCRQKGILFLIYVGFNTNACMITRDYSGFAMSKRGYEILIVRDGTTGMESSRTHDSLAQTENAILFFEMFGQYSISSDEIIGGFNG